MWSDNETTEDLLGFKVHADLIKELVLEEELLPLTIGIYGDWGSGKSSTMQMLREDINAIDNEEVVCLYFNGWLFEGYDDAKTALIESILVQLIEHKRIGATIRDGATELLGSIDWLRAGSFLLKNVAIPAASAYATGGLSLIPDGIKGLASLFKEVTPDQVTSISDALGNDEFGKQLNASKEALSKSQKLGDIPQTVREFRDKFEQLLSNTKIKSLIILIDDLDRCSPERIIDNLEAIKLFLNVNKTAFIIGADERIVRHAIEYKYKSNNFSSKELNDYDSLITDYLEKLIQIPYRIPLLSKSDIETYLSLLICKRDLETEKFNQLHEEFKKFRNLDKQSAFGIEEIKKVINKDIPSSLQMILQISSLITEILKGNPRQVKRFLNAFTLRKRLASVAQLPDFDDAILAKLMVLEYVTPKLFEELNGWQQSNQGISKEIKQLEKEVKGKELHKASEELKETDFTIWSDEKVVKWLQTSPELAGKDLGDYFWISRDKLTSSIDGSNLIPNHIRKLYKDLYNYTTDSNLRTMLKDEVVTLSPTGSGLLFDLVKRNIISTPNDKRNIDILTIAADLECYEAITYLCTSIIATDISKVPAGNAVKIKNLSSKYPDELEELKKSISADSRFSKALKQK